MKTEVLLRKLEGIQTIQSVSDTLKTNKERAAYYVYRLRKKGYVKTKRLSNNRRAYTISFENKFGGTSYFEIINKYSPVKIATPIIYKIYGREPSIEETLVYAIKTGSLRTILAALALFKRINNWDELYGLGKQNHIERQIGALYDLAKELMRVRKMSKRFLHNASPREDYEFHYTISGLKSKDFNHIENKWKIYLPFNKNDLEDYK